MEKGEGVRDSNFPPKKNQSEAADVATATSMDFPAAKKLARQLDFNTVGGSAPPPASSGRTQAVLPEHHQRPVVVQVQHPTPPPPPQPKQPPLQQQQQPLRPLKPESPKARPRQNVEGKDGTPKKQKQCNCKHSRCLKLYCECFASGRYCDGCNCVNCHNNVDNEPARRGAVESTLERNPDAFRPKVASSPHGNRDNREEAGILAKHNRGCHCKKSGCLKKYCECFQANILCSENCRCMDCKNFEGSEERQALFHGDSANNIAYLQQAANAAITGAIGTSGYGSPPVYRKRKAQELSFGGPAAKDLSFDGLAQFQRTNHVKACGPSSSVPGARVATNAPPMGPAKFTYRSLLADLIRTDDMKELCAVLVVYASEAARLHTEERIAKEKMKANNTESSLTSSVTDQQQSPKESDAMKAVADESSSGVQAEGSGSEDAEGSKTRPMSPGTLALMCDEEDTVFLNSGSNGLLDHGVDNDNRLPNGQVITEAYGEQEKTVLTTFRDCLNKLITLGELKETKCASLARSDCGGQSQSNDNHENLKSPFNLKNGDLKQKHEKDM